MNQHEMAGLIFVAERIAQMYPHMSARQVTLATNDLYRRLSSINRAAVRRYWGR